LGVYLKIAHEGLVAGMWEKHQIKIVDKERRKKGSVEVEKII